MRWPVLLLCKLCFITCFAQFTDDFSDGNFSANPVWIGETTKYIVNPAGQLQLNNPIPTDVAHLSSAAATADSTVWEFYLKLAFNPSANNNVRIYLKSDKSDLEAPLNGYFIGLGETGSLDGIDLFRQTGNSETRIINGIDAHAAVSPELRIRVIRTTTGNWTLLSDTTGAYNFSLEGSTTDLSHDQGDYIGVVCKHTPSNADQFFFDDFVVSPLYVDLDPPELLSVRATDTNVLEVDFNEAIDSISALSIANFNLSGGLGNPVSASRNPGNHSRIDLTFSAALQPGVLYWLYTTGLKDLSGNASLIDSMSFQFATLFPGDVVISEIMADPSPAVGLPDKEYVELWNTLPYDISVSGWTFSDASSSVGIPSTTIYADSFLILCSDADVAQFSSFGQTIGVGSLPSLNNAGDQLVLENDTGLVMHSVNYTDDWYNNSSKANGGWSLELIDPTSSCKGQPNWAASIHTLGGTPGWNNSLRGLTNDTVAPELIQVNILDSTSLEVIFNEKPDSLSAVEAANYSVDQGVGSPDSIKIVSGNSSAFILYFPGAFEQGTLYTIHVSDIEDCRGNIGTIQQTQQFIEPLEMVGGDVVINEILFNPLSGGVDFVELVNRSGKIFNMDVLQIIEQDPVSGQIVDQAELNEIDRLFFPGDYVAFTSDPSVIISTYNPPFSDRVLELSGLPNYPDDEGIVIIQTDTAHVIDQFHYYASWHFPLIDDKNGVSLERINTESTTQDQNNWYSAASSVGYATPGYENSQIGIQGKVDGTFSIAQEIFSPNGDGFRDFLSIQYESPLAGNVANIYIFTLDGLKVRHLVNNQLLSTKGTYLWDGLSDESTNVLPGIYVILCEVFDLNGKTNRYKLKCVVSP